MPGGLPIIIIIDSMGGVPKKIVQADPHASAQNQLCNLSKREDMKDHR